MNVGENVNAVPVLLEIARDIDVIHLHHQPVGIVQIIRTEKMTPENFTSLCAFSAQNYESAVSGYRCDVWMCVMLLRVLPIPFTLMQIIKGVTYARLV